MSNSTDIVVEGLISINSTHSVEATTNRLEKILNIKGMNVVARVDHAAGANKIGEKLRSTELIIFGNPQAGTPLIQSEQTVAIDLPQKILVWEDKKSNVWISYNDPNYLMKRHHISDRDELISKIGNALKTIVKEASE